MKEIFKTEDLAYLFIETRLLYPNVPAKNWKARSVNISCNRYRNVDGSPFTLADYLVTWWDHNKKCEICPEPKPELHALGMAEDREIAFIDHNHQTNIVRGLLCRNCNVMLGYASESKRRLCNGVVYLENHGDYEKKVPRIRDYIDQLDK